MGVFAWLECVFELWILAFCFPGWRTERAVETCLLHTRIFVGYPLLAHGPQKVVQNRMWPSGWRFLTSWHTVPSWGTLWGVEKMAAPIYHSLVHWSCSRGKEGKVQIMGWIGIQSYPWGRFRHFFLTAPAASPYKSIGRGHIWMNTGRDALLESCWPSKRQGKLFYARSDFWFIWFMISQHSSENQ